MKRIPILFLLLMAVFLTACSGTLPVELNFLPTNTRAPETATPEITATATATLVPLPTLTATATFTPVPTRRSPFPVTLGTPLPDPGFQRIGSGNVSLLRKVLQHTIALRQATIISANGERVMLGTSDGIYLFDRQGNRLGYWPEIKLAIVDCLACLAVNEDASRFAVASRREGLWQIQVYDVIENETKLVKTFDGPESFGLQDNAASVAISPDGGFIAYGFDGSFFQVYSLFQEQSIFEYRGSFQSLQFSRGGQYIYARRGKELLIWDIYSLEDGFRNLLLPAEDTALDFSYGGEYVAIAFSSKIHLYRITPLKLVREILVEPAYVTDRIWQIAFLSDETLRGYALQWDVNSKTGQAVIGEWAVASGEVINIQETETDSINIFDDFQNIKFPQEQLVGGLEANKYSAMRFIGSDLLLVSNPNIVCTFKLTNGTTDCQSQFDVILHPADGPVFREVRQEKNTLLLSPLGETIFDLDAYPVVWLGRTADFVLLDTGTTTDLYLKSRDLPVQSVPGNFRAAGENNNLITFLTRQNSELLYLTLVEKSTQKTLFQKKDSRLFDLLAMGTNGSIYFLREDWDNNQAILKMIPPGTDEVSDLLRIDLLAEPISMAISPHNILAVGMQDGSVTIVSLDSLTQQTFQALQGPVDEIAISPDSRYLAVAGKNGITVFAVIP